MCLPEAGPPVTLSITVPKVPIIELARFRTHSPGSGTVILSAPARLACLLMKLCKAAFLSDRLGEW